MSPVILRGVQGEPLAEIIKSWSLKSWSNLGETYHPRSHRCLQVEDLDCMCMPEPQKNISKIVRNFFSICSDSPRLELSNPDENIFINFSCCSIMSSREKSKICSSSRLSIKPVEIMKYLTSSFYSFYVTKKDPQTPASVFISPIFSNTLTRGAINIKNPARMIRSARGGAEKGMRMKKHRAAFYFMCLALWFNVLNWGWCVMKDWKIHHRERARVQMKYDAIIFQPVT